MTMLLEAGATAREKLMRDAPKKLPEISPCASLNLRRCYFLCETHHRHASLVSSNTRDAPPPRASRVFEIFFFDFFSEFVFFSKKFKKV